MKLLRDCLPAVPEPMMKSDSLNFCLAVQRLMTVIMQSKLSVVVRDAIVGSRDLNIVG